MANQNNLETSKSILIIEDDASLRQAIAVKLESLGFLVLEAGDGATGLDAALKNHPNAILLDIEMPKMDGLTMLHKLRENKWGKYASVVILTNFDTNDERLTHVVTDQPSYYLVKSENSLEEIVEKLNGIFDLQDKEVQLY